MRAAMLVASRGASRDSARTMNSSPPMRATVSPDAHERREAVAHLDEELVSGGVTERVVDHLEVVEIDEHERGGPGGAPRPVKGVAEAVEEERTVGEPGQRIVERLPGEPGRRLRPLRDVPGVGHDAPHRRVIEAVRRGNLHVSPRSVGGDHAGVDAHDAPGRLQQLLVGLERRRRRHRGGGTR